MLYRMLSSIPLQTHNCNSNGSHEMVQLLCSQSASVHQRDDEGWMPLTYATHVVCT